MTCDENDDVKTEDTHEEFAERSLQIVHEDDLAKGQLLVVLNIKGSKETAPIMGQAFEVTAVCLPYFIAKIYSKTDVVTLDTRYLKLMRVTEEFAKAQAEAAAVPKRGPQA